MPALIHSAAAHYYARVLYNRSMSHIDAIRAYYDRNTRLFLRFGSSKEIQSIHRALWLPGLTSLAQALNAANALILAEAQALGRAVLIADLGCGVGASLLHMLPHLPAGSRGFGLTLSQLQAQLGGRIFKAEAVPGLICEADFQHLPLAAGFDLAYAIESFVHAFEPGQFMAEAARLLRPGGRLILVDDFLRSAAVDKQDQKWLDLYRRGWHVHSLLTPEALAELAAGHGLRLVENRLLSPYLRLQALPDLPARALSRLFRPAWGLHPIVPSMLGSTALQKCLRNGTVEYRWMVLERAAGSAGHAG